jgi:SAM-dependent methyltransferase
MPPKEPSALDERTARTLGHYDANAEAFWSGTRDHDVTQNYAALLAAIARPAPLRLLDFGCGPGRDLLALSALGHDVTGLDGSAEFVGMARERARGPVWQQNFLALELGQAQFDGIFANASLFHVPGAELPRVLRELFQSLVPGGVLFCSNPRSFDHDREGFNGERYGTYLTLGSWLERIAAAGFVIERHYLRPADKPADEQPWLAVVARRPLTGNASELELVDQLRGVVAE